MLGLTNLIVNPVLAEVATPVAGPTAVQPRVAPGAINLWIYVRWILSSSQLCRLVFNKTVKTSFKTHTSDRNQHVHRSRFQVNLKSL